MKTPQGSMPGSECEQIADGGQSRLHLTLRAVMTGCTRATGAAAAGVDTPPSL